MMPDAILRAVVSGRRSLPYREGVRYFAAVDMSGGPNDNSVLAICHLENDRAVVDLVEKQSGALKPFDPVRAVRQFSERLHEYQIARAYGDKYAGEVFAFRFKDEGIEFRPVSTSASDHYERFEVRTQRRRNRTGRRARDDRGISRTRCPRDQDHARIQLARRLCRCNCARGDHGTGV